MSPQPDRKTLAKTGIVVFFQVTYEWMLKLNDKVLQQSVSLKICTFNAAILFFQFPTGASLFVCFVVIWQYFWKEGQTTF